MLVWLISILIALTPSPLFAVANHCLPVLEAACGDTAALVRQIGEQLNHLNPERGRGYVAADTTALFTEAFSRDLHANLIKRFKALDAQVSRTLGKPSNRDRVELEMSNRALVIAGHELLTATEAQIFHEYIRTVVDGLNRNSWNEQFEVDGMEIRVGTAAHAQTTGREPHPDGSYMTVSTTLLGTGTRYQLPGDAPRTADRGHTLLFNGTGRTKVLPNQPALIHWAPGIAEDRVVLLIRLRRRT